MAWVAALHCRNNRARTVINTEYDAERHRIDRQEKKIDMADGKESARVQTT